MEQWDILDKNRVKTGRIAVRGSFLPKTDFHLIIHTWIRRKSDGCFLISRRVPHIFWGGFWQPTGGSALSGETSAEAAVREAKEELGVTLNETDARLLFSYRFTPIDSPEKPNPPFFLDAWLFDLDEESEQSLTVTVQKEEVADYTWATLKEITEMVKNGAFMPFEQTWEPYWRVFAVAVRFPQTIQAARAWGSAQIALGNSQTPELDASLLLAHTIGVEKDALYARARDTICFEELVAYGRLLLRRNTGEPVAYIVGKKAFWNDEFFVTPDVLIPKADTELLVELASNEIIRRIKSRAEIHGSTADESRSTVHRTTLNESNARFEATRLRDEMHRMSADETCAPMHDLTADESRGTVHRATLNESNARFEATRFRDEMHRMSANETCAPMPSDSAESFLVADVCTGSGCIVVSVIKEVSAFVQNRSECRQFLPRFYATDISPKALAVAQKNADTLLLPYDRTRLVFAQGDLCTPLFRLHRASARQTATAASDSTAEAHAFIASCVTDNTSRVHDASNLNDSPRAHDASTLNDSPRAFDASNLNDSPRVFDAFNLNDAPRAFDASNLNDASRVHDASCVTDNAFPQFDVIVSNPPYVPTETARALLEDGRNEPMLALDGGADGLDVIKRLIGQVWRALKKNGILFLETGEYNAEQTRALLRAQGFTGVETANDLGGQPRVTWAIKP